MQKLLDSSVTEPEVRPTWVANELTTTRMERDSHAQIQDLLAF